MKKTLCSVALVGSALLFICGLASGQATETVLYNFGSFIGDARLPSGKLLFDSGGNIYGVTNMGGAHCISNYGCGTVYRLSPRRSGEWSETILYSFCSTGDPSSCPDGAYPYAGLVADLDGNIYGTTSSGGTNGLGTVFRLSPPSIKGESWTQTVLWTFSMSSDNGSRPYFGELSMDAAGNIYGTTLGGGTNGLGVVYELSAQGDGTYTFSILHSFSGNDGASPEYGVVLDGAGNLYGTTTQGGRGVFICNQGCGVVYELSQSGAAWSETVLYEFDGIVGAYPISPISINGAGNLYGTFEVGGTGECLIGSGSCGGVFRLVPGTNRRYAFYYNNNGGLDGGNPQSGVAIGPGNTLYGTVGVSIGSVYMLQNSVETVLYNFCSLPNCSDGSVPSFGNIVVRGGALYGTTGGGGNEGLGVVYQLHR